MQIHQTFVNKCNDDFWYYPKRAFCWALWVLAIMSVSDAFLVNDAAADIVFTNTHTFTGSSTTTGGTDRIDGGNTGTALSTVLQNINFDFTSIKQIESITSRGSLPYCVGSSGCSYDGTNYGGNTHGGNTANIIPSANVSNIVTKQVPFTATVDGITYGTGGIGWQKDPATTSSSYFNYFIIFDSVNTAYANSLTGLHIINFTYDTTVYSNFWSYNYLCSFNCGGFTWTAGNLLQIHTTDGKTTGGATIIGSTTQDTIVTTFNKQGATFGYVNVSKGNANLFTNLTNSTGFIIDQQTSTSDLVIFTDYTAGLNMFMNHVLLNLWNNFTITDANGNVVGPTPTPIPGNGGSPSGQIQFDFSNATQSSPYGINVSISDANFSSLKTYFIDVIDPGHQQELGFPISFRTQQYNTSRMWTFRLLGTYNATLSYCTLFVFCADIDTASVLVNPVTYAYNISTDKSDYFTGQTINVTAVNPSPNTVFVNVFLDAGGQGKIDDAPVTAGTTRYFNIPVTSDMVFGKWLATIDTMGDGNGRVAETSFNISIPTAGQAVGVRWDINYFLGRTNNLYYTTNGNSSTVAVSKPIPGTNTTTLSDTFTVAGSTSSFKPYLMDVTGYWTASITDSGNSSNISYANMTVLASQTCNLNNPDYACWNNASYSPGDSFKIDYKATNLPVGQAALLMLVISDPENTIVTNKTIINNVLITSSNVPAAGSMTGKFKSTAKPGKWQAALVISCVTTAACTDETQLAEGFTFVVAPAPTVSPTPPIPSGQEASGSMQDNILFFMSTKAFWGVLLFAVLLVTGRNHANIGYIAFIIANIFAVIGLFDPFKWYILAVSWIGAGIFFYVGRQASNGGT